MLKNKSVKCLFIFIVLSLIVFQSNIVAQDKKKCLFISDDPWPGTDLDQELIAYLEQTYNVEIFDDDTEIGAGTPSIDEIKTYDFGFISETVDSKVLIPLKGAPIPLFYLELYARTYTTGWCPHPGEFWGGVGSGTIKIVDDTGHPLSAGYAKDAEIEIVEGSDEPDAWLTYCNPGIEIIPIAVLASDPTKYNIFGVEAGTALYPNASDQVDPNLLSENRCAAFGIHSAAFASMTADAWKFIDAGIEWILSGEVAVEKDDAAKPISFELAQNYPNPFNPTTEISFALAKPGYTSLTVHNVLGQLVATLVDQDMRVGIYRVTLDATDLPSGIYFYQIKSGEFTQVKKMTLMK